jgi:tetratricopeptide (TPR) repeat protein
MNDKNIYIQRFLVIAFCFISLTTFSQSSAIAKPDTASLAKKVKYGEGLSISTVGFWDSLKNDCETALLKCKPADPTYKTHKKLFVRSLSSLGVAFHVHGADSKALDCFQRVLAAAIELGEKAEIASAYTNIGEIYNSQGNITRGLEYLLKGFDLRNSLGNKVDLANSYSCLANVYLAQGDIAKALDHYEHALKLHESVNNQNGAARVLNSIGVIYKNQGETSKAMEYFLKSLRIHERTGDYHSITNSLNNIGTSYYEQGDVAKALDYLGRCLKLQEKMDERSGIANTLNNLGAIYNTKGDPSVTGSAAGSKEAGYKKALEYFEKSMEIKKAIGDKKGQSYTLNNIAAIYFQQKNYDRALAYCITGMDLSKELGIPDNIRNIAKKLFQLYKIEGDHKAALENFELYVQMRDSINNVATRKASIRSQLKYEYEKQAAADSVAHAKESEIKSAELSRQSAEIKAKKNQQVALFGGLALVCLFSIFMFNRYKVTQKQKIVIEQQKEVVVEQKKLVEEKQAEVLDSIKYARRIQMAQIPSEKRVHLILKRMQGPEVK